MNRVRRKIIQLYKAYGHKRDDRGSAIVIVIIAMAMIGILATTLLWMAYMNYMIKVADIRNKNSFYSAEEVMEQIMAGLQSTSADAVGVAYRDVMANWEDLGTGDNRYNVFAATYMDTLLEKLKDPSLGNGYYDRDKLKAYVDTDIFLEASPKEGVDVTAWEKGGADPAGKPAKMELVNNNCIILHDIYVSYTDSENRVSIVQTDISIDVPKLIFENAGSIDGLYEYSLIGNAGIEVVGGGGTTTAEGSIYAGTDADGKGGLLVNPASTLSLDKAKRVITKGDIVVKGPAASLVVRDMPGEDNRVYARNISLENGTVSLDSKTYVANDLTLEGSGSSRATLTKEYYGYGYSTNNGFTGESAIDPASSSAIIINGKNSTVDMRGINRLLIAGRSYIGEASTRAEAEFNRQQIEDGLRSPGSPVLMGESIAVKGGQIAYLVPAECIGTLDGETVIGQNPLNGEKVSDMGEMLEAYGGFSGSTGSVDTEKLFCEVDFGKKVYRLGNKSLSEFGLVDMDRIRTVNVPYQGGTLRYYYLVMTKEQAERYFVQYYDFHSNKKSIDRYFDKYVSGGILLGDFDAPDNQYTILGNSLVSSAISESGVTLLTGIDQSTLNPDEEGGGDGTPGGDDDAGTNPPADPDAYKETGENAEEVTNQKEEDDVIALSAKISGDYRALTFNLTEDASMVPADPELAKNFYVFNNIIKENQVTTYLDDNHTNRVVYETDSGLQAYLTREPEVSVSALDSKTRLIIAYGNVKVDANFTGLIIAKGKITIDSVPQPSIKQNKMDLYKVLEAKNRDGTADTITPIDLFVNGGGSMVNGAESAPVDDAGNLVIDYSEIVRYMNWIKK